MSQPLDEGLIRDTLCGLELQLIELVENQTRAEVQGRTEDAAAYQPEIDSLHNDLARTAEFISASSSEIDRHGS